MNSRFVSSETWAPSPLSPCISLVSLPCYNGGKELRSRVFDMHYLRARTSVDSSFLLSSLPSCIFLQLEKCAQDLGSTSKAVGSSMAQLLTCAAQGNEHYTGEIRNLPASVWLGADHWAGGGSALISQ